VLPIFICLCAKFWHDFTTTGDSGLLPEMKKFNTNSVVNCLKELKLKYKGIDSQDGKIGGSSTGTNSSTLKYTLTILVLLTLVIIFIIFFRNKKMLKA
jgi:hypothetical protein